MILTAGIDVGSSSVKVAIMQSPEGSGRDRKGAKVLGKAAERIRRRDQREVIALAMNQAMEEARLKQGDLHYVATTGEGELVEARTGHFYGMTAHARGAVFLDPEARGAVDVGALHGRALRFDDKSKVLDYRMTSQCASGTGQFLENIARYLGITQAEIGPLSLEGSSPEKISGICAVLAETDVINMVSRGISIPNILKGIHESMATRFVKLLRSIKVDGVVLLTGGLSKDVGLLRAMEESIAEDKVSRITARAHEDGIYAGALGAALWGAFRHERLNTKRAA